MHFRGPLNRKIKVNMGNLKQNHFGNQKQALLTGYLLVVFGIFISFSLDLVLRVTQFLNFLGPRYICFANLVVPASEYNLLVSFVLIFLGVRIILQRVTSFQVFIRCRIIFTSNLLFSMGNRWKIFFINWHDASNSN